jgi:hypothetical protein
VIDWDAAAAAIHERGSEPVVYRRVGFEDEPLAVIWIDNRAGTFQGPGETARAVIVEIRKAHLPTRPEKPDRLLRGKDLTLWKPNEVTDRDDLGAWSVVLERVAP